MTNLEKLTIETELEQQSDHSLAEVLELPGVLVYGKSEPEAIDKVVSQKLFSNKELT
jgi:hypothetical protein